jgi:hypothetical protein
MILKTLCCLLLKDGTTLSRSPRGQAADAYAPPKANRSTLDFFVASWETASRPVRGGRRKRSRPEESRSTKSDERDQNFRALGQACALLWLSPGTAFLLLDTAVDCAAIVLGMHLKKLTASSPAYAARRTIHETRG